jgi:hypothetical protein
LAQPLQSVTTPAIGRGDIGDSDRLQAEPVEEHSQCISVVKKQDDNQEYIYTPYITVKGKRVYKPGGGVYRIPVARLKKR